jgi:quinol monooxygenase YgiN
VATLPWTITEPTEPGSDAVVLGSRLELRSFRHIPAFMSSALKLRKQVLDMPGALGVSLIAQPSRKTFWTLSAWTDEAALEAFVATPAHLAVMRRFHDRLDHPSFATWTVPTAELPKPRSNASAMWDDARQRLVAANNGGDR